MNLVSIENIALSFGEKKLFEGLSFGISQGQKIALVKNGEEQLLELETLLFSTGNYRQFSYKILEPLAKSLSSVSINDSKIKASDNNDFDDVWKTLK